MYRRPAEPPRARPAGRPLPRDLVSDGGTRAQQPRGSMEEDPTSSPWRRRDSARRASIRRKPCAAELDGAGAKQPEAPGRASGPAGLDAPPLRRGPIAESDQWVTFAG